MYWCEYKTKGVNRNMTNKSRYFLEVNFVEVKIFGFIQVKMTMLKGIKVEGITCTKALSRIITS